MNLSCAAKANISDTNERSDAPENCNFFKMINIGILLAAQWTVKPIMVATIFSFFPAAYDY